MMKRNLGIRKSLAPILKSRFRYAWNKFNPQATYAQHSEDLVMLEIFGEVNKFIDIGANDGYTCSNTFLFALRGAEGLLFEPTSSMFTRLSALYGWERSMICINEGLSNVEDTVLIKSDGLLSYISSTQDEGLKKLLSSYYKKDLVSEEILVKPLNFWLDCYPNFKQCDFVSLDVEGHELYVLQGIDFTLFQTNCFIIETHAQGDSIQWMHQDYKLIDQLLSQNSYKAVLKNKINTFWFHQSAIDSKKLQEVERKFPNYELPFGL